VGKVNLADLKEEPPKAEQPTGPAAASIEDSQGAAADAAGGAVHG